MGFVGGVVLGAVVGFGLGKTREAEPPARLVDRPSTRSDEQPERSPNPERAGTSPDGRVDGRRAKETAADRDVPGPASPAPHAAAVRKRVIEAYRRRTGADKEPPADLLEAGLREVQRKVDSQRVAWANWVGSALHDREKARAVVGELTQTPIVFQIRTTQTATARLDRPGNSGPLAIDPELHAHENSIHATTGLVPPGQVLIVERARLDVRLHGGEVEIKLPGLSVQRWKGKRRVSIQLVGLQLVHHGQEAALSLRGSRVAASLEVHGRVVSEAAAAAATVVPFRMGGEVTGWLSAKPAVLQVYADHGGGNPRRVYLDGSVHRIDALEPESIWSDTLDLRRGNDSRAHYRNCGLVPPGKAYRVRRIEYRARLDVRSPQHSDVRIAVGGKQVVRETAAGGERVRGVWTGDVRIRGGQEKGVSVTCSYYGLAEIIVYGELLEDGE